MSINWQDSTDVAIFSVCVGLSMSAAGYISYRFRQNLFSRWLRPSNDTLPTKNDITEASKRDLPMNKRNSRIASSTQRQSRSDSMSYNVSMSGHPTSPTATRHNRVSSDTDRKYIACSHCHATLALPLSNSSPVVQCIYCKCINNIEPASSIDTNERSQISKNTHSSKSQSRTVSNNSRPKFKYDMDEPSAAEAAAAAAAAVISPPRIPVTPPFPSSSSSSNIQRPHYDVESSTSIAVGKVQFSAHDDYEPSVLSRPRPRQGSVSLPSVIRKSVGSLVASKPQAVKDKDVPTVGDLVADELDEEYVADEDEERESSMVINEEDGEVDEFYYEQSQRRDVDVSVGGHTPPQDIELDMETLQQQPQQYDLETDLQYEPDPTQHRPQGMYELPHESPSMNSQLSHDEALEGEIGAIISDLRMGGNQTYHEQDHDDPISTANMQE